MNILKNLYSLKLNLRNSLEFVRVIKKVIYGIFMDIEDFDWYNRLVNIHKVGSGDPTNFPINKKIVESKNLSYYLQEYLIGI